MTHSYTLFNGQTPAEGEVVERVRTSRGDVEIVLTQQEAENLRAGRQLMERWHGVLAVLAKS